MKSFNSNIIARSDQSESLVGITAVASPSVTYFVSSFLAPCTTAVKISLALIASTIGSYEYISACVSSKLTT
jgi:hypothetical protein